DQPLHDRDASWSSPEHGDRARGLARVGRHRLLRLRTAALRAVRTTRQVVPAGDGMPQRAVNSPKGMAVDVARIKSTSGTAPARILLRESRIVERERSRAVSASPALMASI